MKLASSVVFEPPPGERSPDTSLWLARLAGFILSIFGWKVGDVTPNFPKMIVIGAPHTSNWDGLIMVLFALVLRVRLQWVGKHTLFKFPFGGLMRLAGGVPLNRSTTKNAVEQTIQVFNEHEKMALVVAPEGTRGKVDHWKTGFYYIALGANVPIVMGYVDYGRKQAGLGPAIMPSGDIEADMEVFRTFYSDITPRHPEKKGTVALPPPKPT